MINLNELDKIQQLEKLIDVLPLEYFRDFYNRFPTYHIYGLNLYDVIAFTSDIPGKCIHSLYIGCFYNENYEVYHTFLIFDNDMNELDYVVYFNNERIIFYLNNLKMIVDHGYYLSLSDISNLILKYSSNEYYGISYSDTLEKLKSISENTEKLIKFKIDKIEENFKNED